MRIFVVRLHGRAISVRRKGVDERNIVRSKKRAVPGDPGRSYACHCVHATWPRLCCLPPFVGHPSLMARLCGLNAFRYAFITVIPRSILSRHCESVGYENCRTSSRRTLAMALAHVHSASVAVTQSTRCTALYPNTATSSTYHDNAVVLRSSAATRAARITTHRTNPCRCEEP